MHGVVAAAAGRPLQPLLLLPPVAASIIIALLVVRYPDETKRLASGLFARPEALFAGLAVAVVGFALVDLLFARVVPLGARLLARLSRSEPDATRRASAALATLSSLILVVAAIQVVEVKGDAPARTASTFNVVASFSLPGNPMGIVFRGERDGYISLAEGSILRFELPAPLDAPLGLRTVVEGLPYPRDLAIIGDTLAVGVLGPLPCERPVPQCKWGDLPGVAYPDAERRILEGSKGQVRAFTIDGAGDLVNERILVDDLPVINTQHGVNGIVASADGLFYLSVGHVDWLATIPDVAAAAVTPRKDLLGTVVRFRPDGTSFSVFANGLRNVYGLAFDPSGHLYGVDNDGNTQDGWRREELRVIRERANYGFPLDPTFGPLRGTDNPLWVLDAKGSAGIEWMPKLGAMPGLLLGSCGKLQAVPLADSERGPTVPANENRAPIVTELWQAPGCVTSVKRGPEDMVVMTVFTYGGAGPALFVVRLE